MTRPPPSRVARASSALDWFDFLFAVLLGLFSLLLYMRTLARGVVPNDSAEFQTLAYTLDHAHTTGYEVYIVLAKLFTLLPVNTVAYRVNLFSAFMGALTIVLVYLAAKVLANSRPAACLAAIALAITATFWSQSIIAEVYTAGSAFSAAALLFVLLWLRLDDPRYLFLAGLVGAVGYGVHASTILFAPAVLLLILIRARDFRRIWKPALGGALAGLALFFAAFAFVDYSETNASMFHTAYGPSITRWEMTPEQIDTIGERFVFLALAQQWRSAMFADPGSVIPANTGMLVDFLTRDFAWPVLLFVGIGLVALLVRDRRPGLLLLAAIMVHLCYTLNYRIGDIYVFFVSLYVYLMPLAAEGIALGLRALSHLPHRPAFLAQAACVTLLLYLLVSPHYAERLGFIQAGEARWRFMDLRGSGELDHWYGVIEYNVEALPENAVVLLDWYHLYAHIYAAQVERNRPDLHFLEAYPYAMKPEMASSLLAFIRESLEAGRPVFMMQPYDEVRRGGFTYTSRPVGLSTWYQIELP